MTENYNESSAICEYNQWAGHYRPLCVNAHGQETQQEIGAAADCNNFWSLLAGILTIKMNQL